MDRIDQDILSILIKNPKIPFLKVAKKIGISTQTVINRYEKMKSKGIIQGTFAVIDLSKIGFQGKAFLFATASKDYDPKSMAKEMSQIPNVFLVSEIIGAFDVLVMAVFRNIEEVKEIVNSIKALPSVQKIELALTTDTTFPVREEYGEVNLFINNKNQTMND